MGGVNALCMVGAEECTISKLPSARPAVPASPHSPLYLLEADVICLAAAPTASTAACGGAL